jgi:adenine-specific DNA-methyltransferase
MEYIHDLPESRIKKVIAGEQGGVSKSVNWQGGGSFVYCELMNWTETYIQKTRKAENTAELWAIYQFMLTDEIMSYFLHYYLEDDKLTKEEFNKHTFTEQQSIICELLNKNHLYVNYSERDDQDYKERFEQENNSCTYVESVALSTKFYGY